MEVDGDGEPPRVELTEEDMIATYSLTVWCSDIRYGMKAGLYRISGFGDLQVLGLRFEGLPGRS